MDPDEYLTTKEAAKLKNCTQQYIGDLIRAGRLRATKKGRFWLIKKGDLDDIQPAERSRGRPRRNHIKQALFDQIIERLQSGEVDPVHDKPEATQLFAQEVHQAAEAGDLTAAQVSTIWLRFLEALGMSWLEVLEE